MVNSNAPVCFTILMAGRSSANNAERGIDMQPTEQSTDRLRVFVYGTLKPGEANYSAYCQGKVLEQQDAIALGQLFALSLGYPAMTAGEGRVRGTLLTFRDASALVALDELEDYRPNAPLPHSYERRWVEIFDPAMHSLGYAWAYFMQPEQVVKFQGQVLPEGWWGQNH